MKSPVWVFSLALFPLGLGGFFMGLGDVVVGHRSSNWTEVQGVVLTSKFESTTLAPRQPVIRYSYEVSGSRHVSTRIWPGSNVDYMPLFQRRAVRELHERYAEGAEVPVYVDPANPNMSVLIKGPARAYRWLSIFGFFLLLSVFSPWALGKLAQQERRQ